ncbi:hypothetical protein WICPIJ_001966 [Wickerhamomyces pijperi]|uniref:Major facilitator superfamily (MFS) profile domain-containing protein n=1 Tax=Wickerhamomyces pijperi TaxID=599730 RepID=A0A9P8Q9Z8_WICPI|nr:hypothetical protein WICPIJ_001966 [Wickerhamomyces pijperi]
MSDPQVYFFTLHKTVLQASADLRDINPLDRLYGTRSDASTHQAGIHGLDEEDEEDFQTDIHTKLNWDSFKRHKKVIAYCILISLAGFNFGYDTGVIGGMLQMPSYVNTFGELSHDQETPNGGKMIKSWVKGLIVAIYHIGCIIGGFTIAPISEYLGRKKAIMLSLMVYISAMVMEITAKFSGSWVQFMIGRLVNGLAIGSLGCLGPMFLSETSPTEIRGSVTCLYQLNIVTGVMIGSVVVYGTKSTYQGLDLSWIIPLCVAIGVGTVGLVGVVFVPESSRYLVSRGKYKEAEKSLIEIGDVHYKRTLNDLISKTQLERNVIKNIGFGEMFKDRNNLKKIIIGVAIMWFQQMNGIDYFFYYGVTLFESVGINDSYVTSIILATVNMVVTFPGLFIIERFGRRITLLTGAFFCTIFLLIYATVGTTMIQLNPVDDSVNRTPGMIMIIFTCCFIVTYGISWGPAGQVLVSELYPINIKAKAIAMSTAFNWAANFFIAFCTPIVTEKIHYRYGFVFTGCAFASFWFILLMVPETRGISLEEIDGLFNEKNEQDHEMGSIGRKENNSVNTPINVALLESLTRIPMMRISIATQKLNNTKMITHFKKALSSKFKPIKGKVFPFSLSLAARAGSSRNMDILVTRRTKDSMTLLALLESKPEVGSSRNKIEGDVTNSQAMETLRFSPPEIPLSKSDPMTLSLMCKILNSFKTSNTFLSLVSKAMDLGRRSKALFKTVS